MNKPNRILSMILFVAAPQAALLALLGAAGALGPLFGQPLSAFALGCVLAAAALSALSGVIFRMKDVPAGWTCFVLALQTAGTVLLAVALYQSGAAAAPAGSEALTLLLGGVSMLYLCAALYQGKTGDPKTAWQLAMIVALPFGCAMLLDPSWTWYAGVTVMMNLAAALLAAAAVYFLRWLAAFRKPAPEAGGQAQDASKGIFKLADNFVIVLIFSLVMPLSGLALNLAMGNLFGNFSSPWLFVLVGMNGVLMLPPVRNRLLSPLYLYVKMICFCAILYLTIAMIPGWPAGLLGILAYGLGLLVFSPPFTVVVETAQVVRDVKTLDLRWSKAAVAAVAALGMLTLPLAVAADLAADKANYQTALAYMDPRADEQQPVSGYRLSRTLSQMDAQGRQRARSFFDSWDGASGDYAPLYSNLYGDVVLEGKTLSSSSSERMRAVFFDQTSAQRAGRTSYMGDAFVPGSPGVALTAADSHTEFDEEAGAYKTWIDLTITNEKADSTWARDEYATRFDLPAGCFVTGFYLDVDGARKYGMLTDRRAAQITYESVVSVRQDPGILYYADEDTLELRVFPFSGGEARQAGFCVMHSQPETLELDGQTVALAAPDSDVRPLDTGAAVLIPAAYKQKLEPVYRDEVFWFVIDASGNSPVNEHILKVRDYAERNGIADARVIFASSRAQEVALSDLPDEKQLINGRFDMTLGGQRIAARGGFNLETAVYRAMAGEAENGGTYPVIVAVSDNMPAAALPRGGYGLTRFPESDYYYNLNYDLTLTPYRFSDNTTDGQAVKQPYANQALRYGDLVVDALPRASVAYRGGEAAFGGDEYANAFLAVRRALEGDAEIGVVRDSLRGGVLTPATAFTVFETREQEKQLLDLQERIMSGDYRDAAGWFAPGDTPVNMDETVDLAVALALAAGLAALAWAARRRKSRKA